MSPDVTAIDARAAAPEVRSLLGVGADGASFAATFGAGEGELWRLQKDAVTAALQRRLVALRSIEHDALLPIEELALDRDRPRLSIGAGALVWGVEAWPADPRELAVELARLYDGLAQAHRLDVVHGRLGPEHVGRTRDGRLVLDLTGLSVRPPTSATPLAPELARGVPSAATDVWALATIAGTLAASGALPLERMTIADPEARPTARAAAEILAGAEADVTAAQGSATGAAPAAFDPAVDEGTLLGVPRRLGAYRLIEPIGAGGMGRVFRGKDVGGGPDVAVKVLLSAWSSDQEIVARFRREARVLARLETPHVARFIAANEDAGFHYLVMEHVRAESAEKLIRAKKKLDVELAVHIAADVARALVEVHALGLVHRDVKPANILVGPTDAGPPAVKLCDFGIARPTVAGGPDQLTRDGTPGTPSFMAPEQVEGGTVDARSDVYALGATLFTFLAGRPPFVGTAHFVMVSHVTEAPPSILELEPSVPPAISSVVMRCLQKAPDERYPDAAALLDALEEARRGASAYLDALPQPLGVEGTPRVYDFSWTLRAEPEELWPHVSNTERLNRAAGLDEVEWSHSLPERAGEGYVRTEGRFRAAGMELRWKENPFEWVAPHRLGVVREYVSGPFEWLRNTVELTRRDEGGTTLRHKIEIRPRSLLGRAAATVEVGLRLRRGLERVYHHIDTACVVAREGGAASGAHDPFEDPAKVSSGLRAQIDARVARVLEAGGDPFVAEALADYVCTAPGPKLGRIRPRPWAAERDFTEAAVLDTFLLAASEGVLALTWDILCPSCRIPSSIEESLRALETHGRCEVCDLDFELDMARSVELVFRAHPALRQADLGVYCIGGPAHSPHVLAQVRLAPNERFTLELALEEGRYRVAGRGLPHRHGFSVDARAPFSTWDLPLREGAAPEAARSLAVGPQRIVLTNDLPHEVLVRLERASDRVDAVTAADAASSARFRALFPEQVLAPERLVAISNVAIVFAQVADALARYEADESLVHEELVALADEVDRAAALEGGAVVRLSGDGVMAVFTDRVAAARAALRVADPRGRVGVSVHAGPARMTTIGGRLDYFGRTLHAAELMGRWTAPGELLVGEPLLSDPALVAFFDGHVETDGYVRVGSLLVARTRVRPDAPRLEADALSRAG